MRPDYTHITAVVDSSYSMKKIKESTIGGFNTFVDGQKKAPGKATFTQIHFSSGLYKKQDNHIIQKGWLVRAPMVFPPIGGHGIDAQVAYDPYYVVDDHVDIQLVKMLTEDTFVPYGDTPLLDSIGRAIIETGQWLATLSEEERPSKVLMVIVTDGDENTSKTYNYEQIASMINLQESVYSWTFVYLGANQDAIATAAKMGIKAGLAATYGTTREAVGATYSMLNAKAALYRSAVNASAGADAMAFTDEERVVALNGETPTT